MNAPQMLRDGRTRGLVHPSWRIGGAAVVALLAACGGSSGSSGTDNPAPTAADQVLSVSSSGAGSVSSSPSGIGCGTVCSASFTNGTSVTLTASPSSGNAFIGWSGACTGTGQCTVAMNTARSVTASFGPVADTAAPSAPGGLTAVAVSANAVQLQWTASTDDVGVVGYRVFRDGGTAALASPSTTSFTDNTVAAGTRYSYRVLAVDAAGNTSALSTAAAATTPAASARSCPPFPAFPDTQCTGVPAGYPLSAVNGNLSTTSAGQVIDGKNISGDLIVNHDNVIITNSRIKGRVQSAGRKGLTLQDVDLGADACPASNNGGVRLITSDSGYTLVRAYLHHNGDDLLITGGGGSVVIQDSLIKNTCFYAGDHLDAVQFYDPGGVGHVTILHSVIDVRPVNSTDKGNAAVFWADTPGPGSTLTISQSLLAGGNVTLAPYDAGAGSGVVIDVNNTRFVRGLYAGSACFLGGNQPASHSPTIPFNGTEGIKWADNAYDDGVPLPSCQ